MSNEANAKTIETIKKLFAKGNDPSVNETEAMLFISKGQQLLVENRLSLADLQTAEVVTDPIVEEKWFPLYANMGWRKILATSLGRYCMVKVILWREFGPDAKGAYKDKHGFNIIGRQTSIDVFKEMMSYLCTTTVRLGLEYSKKSGKKNDRVPFERGCGDRLADRVDALYIERTMQAATPTGSREIALYKSELAEAEDYAKANIKTKPVKILNNTNTAAGYAGKLAANNVHLGAKDSPSNTLDKPSPKLSVTKYHFVFKHIDVKITQAQINDFSSQFNSGGDAPEFMSDDWKEAFVDLIYSKHDPHHTLESDDEWQNLDLKDAITVD